MPNPPNYFRLTAIVYWPVRANLGVHKVRIKGPVTRDRVVDFSIEYESTISVAGIVFPAIGWTKCALSFDWPFSGDRDGFEKWVSGDSAKKNITDLIIGYQNFFIDYIKYKAPYSPEIQNIRHFGPAEWPYLDVKFDNTDVLMRLNSSLRSEVSAQKLNIDTDDLSNGYELPFSLRGLLRACDLAECGYPTEALLLSFAIVDAAIQRVLKKGMERLSITAEEANALLRNTTQSRVATFLGPIMKLTFNVSLEEHNSSLFGQLTSLNKMRNDAIHNGLEIKRSQARDACVCAFDVLDFLRQYGDSTIKLPPRPRFMDT